MLDREALKDLLGANYDPHDIIDMLEITSFELIEYLDELIDEQADRLTEIVLCDQEGTED
jgi:chaperonin GroEL (HSP60 family)